MSFNTITEFENSDADYEQHMLQNEDNSDENSQLLNSQSPEISQMKI